MSQGRVALLRRVLEQGVGTEVEVEVERSRVRTGLRSHFAVLGRNGGPVCTVTPAGLHRHQVIVRFGRFAADCIAQMQRAPNERWQVARALVDAVAATHALSIGPQQELATWTIPDSSFELEVSVRGIETPSSEADLARTGERVMVPLMAAMAELIGYDEGETGASDIEGEQITSLVTRRERSPRNRLLCLSIHGNRCMGCGTVPSDIYGTAGEIIEVHHLEPVSLLTSPRAYDPTKDLVPLCPNCHRAVHLRRPVPYTIEELRGLLREGR